MRKVARIALIAIFLQLFTGVVTAEALPTTPKISKLAVSGTVVNLGIAPKISPVSANHEIEISTVAPVKIVKVIKTKSSEIAVKLVPFTSYKVRVRNSANPSKWTTTRNFTTKSDPVLGLSATNVTHTTAEVSWTPVNGATAYDVILNKTLLVSVTTPKYTIAKLKPGSSNSLVIIPKTSKVLGTQSAIVSINTSDSSPSNLQATLVTPLGSTLTWDAISNATSYNLYSNSKLLINTKSLSHVISDQFPGTLNSYQISAVFGESESAKSDAIEVSTLIDTPEALAISSVSSSSATFSWNLDKNASSYAVNLFDATGTSEIQTKTVAGSLNSVIFSGLAIETVYTVGIKFIYGKTESKQSALKSFATVKPVMTNVVMSNVTTVSATLNWYPLPGVITYEVYRDGVIIPAVTAALTTASVSYTFTGLSPGVSHKFSVRGSYLDGTKTSVFTNMAEVNQALLTDPAFAPVIGSAPVITLPYATVPIVGATLSASNGLWTSVTPVTGYAYQWQRSLDAGGTWANLANETKSTYKVVASDYAFRLRVRVIATNINGSSLSAFSATSSPVAETYNVQIPVVRGILVSGQLLEVTDGSWSSDYPLTFRYQWKRDGVAISGSISPSYTLIDGDIGSTISVSVIAGSSLGTVSADSTVRSVVAAAGNTVAPTVTGSVRVYQTLTTTSGTWLKSPTITYQWQRSSDGALWNNIASATNSTYALTLDDVGFYIRSQAFGSRTVSIVYLYTAPSLPTIVVPAFSATSTSAPVVSGSWTEGSMLSTTNGSWNLTGAYTYQWQRSTDNSTYTSISGATSSTYLLVAADASNYVRVQVYLTGASGADGVAYSVPTAKVGAPYNTLAPVISGTLRVGLTQTVTTGTWSGSPTFTYQWQTSTDGIAWANVGSATSSTYTPTYTVANLRLRAVVSGVNAVDTVTATSQVVQGFLAPIASAVPAITVSGGTGVVQSGQTLATSDGTWPNTSAGFAYTWHRSSDGGTTWTNIGGQTTANYVLVAGDVGYLIRSQVTVTTNAGSSTAYSLPTVAVAPAP